MIIVGTRDVARNTKQIFELAKQDKVLVRRPGDDGYVNLIVSDSPSENFFSEKWLKEFLAIPNEYRCNPFDHSPDGDLFFADSRNLESIKKQKTTK